MHGQYIDGKKKYCLQCCLQVSGTVSWLNFWYCCSANILQHCLQALFTSIACNVVCMYLRQFLDTSFVLPLCQYTATLFASTVCTIVCKYLRQFLGSSFGFTTLPIYCNIVCKYYLQCCLQVSETVSWLKLQCCYSANILQHCLQVLLTMLFASI